MAYEQDWDGPPAECELPDAFWGFSGQTFLGRHTLARIRRRDPSLRALSIGANVEEGVDRCDAERDAYVDSLKALTELP